MDLVQPRSSDATLLDLRGKVGVSTPLSIQERIAAELEGSECDIITAAGVLGGVRSAGETCALVANNEDGAYCHSTELLVCEAARLGAAMQARERQPDWDQYLVRDPWFAVEGERDFLASESLSASASVLALVIVRARGRHVV